MSEVERPPHYPVMLDLVGRLAVVIGAGRPAVRSAAALCKHGADVVVITPEREHDLIRMEADGLLTVESRGYVRGDLEGAFIAVAASGSPETDAAIADEARERGTLINIRRDASASSYIVPSVITRGDLQIAISTEGKAPSVTKQVKRGISDAHGWEWGPYVELVAELRALAIERTGLSDSDLGPLFASVTDSDVLYRIRSGEEVTAEELYQAYVDSLEKPGDTDGMAFDE